MNVDPGFESSPQLPFRRPQDRSSMQGIPLGNASALLNHLGIDEPEDIDIEAVAQACDATVVYDTLEGCEARLIGARGRAIITVDAHAPRSRQRFSAAHELGHWIYDRGKVAFACAEGQFVTEWGRANPERRANRFAADLLLPRRMFKRHTRNRPLTFATVRALSHRFETSLTATAIRLVELGGFPGLLVCYNQGRRCWETRNHMVPASLRAKERLDQPLRPGRRSIRADALIEHPDSGRYTVEVDALPLTGFAKDALLMLIWWRDEAQIVDATRSSV